MTRVGCWCGTAHFIPFFSPAFRGSLGSAGGITHHASCLVEPHGVHVGRATKSRLLGGRRPSAPSEVPNRGPSWRRRSSNDAGRVPSAIETDALP